MPVRVGIINYPPNALPIRNGKYIVIGGCSTFYTIPDRPDEVVKCPKPFDEYIHNVEIEKRVYRRLGKHPNLVNVVEMDDYGVYLECVSHGSLHKYYRIGSKATLHEKVAWCCDITIVVEYVHQKNVRHADLSGRNLLLNSARMILLCDFSGSYINGEKATIWAEVGFRHPDKSEFYQPSICAELHALGSVLYEIVTSTKPYEGLEEHVVIECVERGEYPDVSEVPLGDVMTGCWKGAFGSAAEVAEAIAHSGMHTVHYLARPL